MEAQTSVWNAGAKDFIRQPDYKTQLMACQLYAAHVLGLPTQRAENLNAELPPPPQEDSFGMLVKSSAMRDAARRQIDAAERKAAAIELQKLSQASAS